MKQQLEGGIKRGARIEFRETRRTRLSPGLCPNGQNASSQNAFPARAGEDSRVEQPPRLLHMRILFQSPFHTRFRGTFLLPQLLRTGMVIPL